MKKLTSSAALGGLLVIVAGCLWGCTGLFVGRVNSAGIAAMEIVELRGILTALLMLPIMLCIDRKLFRIRLKDLWCFIGSGVLSVLFFNFCYYTTIRQSGMAIAAVLLYTSPIFVMLMSLWLFRERMTVRKVTSLLLTVVGCVFVSGIFTAGGTFTPGGLALGIGAGFGYALYSIFSRYALQRGYQPMTITFYTFLLSAVGGVFFTDFKLIATSSAENGLGLWLPLVAYVAVGTIGAYLLYTAGLKHIDNSKASVMAAVEPACATLLQIMVLRVLPDAYTMVGITLVLGAIVWLNMGKENA